MASIRFYRCVNCNASPASILVAAMPSDFDHERLHYLRQAVKLGSIRGAAERLNVNPSTVSRQIALLEKQVSTTLLERYGRGVRATEAGQLLVDYAGIQDSARKDTLAKLADLKTLKRATSSLSPARAISAICSAGRFRNFAGDFPI